MSDLHPALVELYATKARISAEFRNDVRQFAAMIREREEQSKKRGIKFVDLSRKGPSAYSRRMLTGPLPRNYWKRKPVRPLVDPIEEEIKEIVKKSAQLRSRTSAA